MNFLKCSNRWRAANSQPVFILWLSVAICGYSWLLVAIRGYSWLLVAIRGYSWLSVATRGYLWLSVATRGYLWLLVAIRGYLWPTPSHYTHYTILLILGILQPCPLRVACYRSYRISHILRKFRFVLIDVIHKVYE